MPSIVRILSSDEFALQPAGNGCNSTLKPSAYIELACYPGGKSGFFNEHTIAVAKEAVFLFDGFPVGVHHIVAPRKRTD